MRHIISILVVAATVLAGCHSPSPVHTQTTAPAVTATPTATTAATVTAPPPFRPMLVTTLGTHTSSGGRWRIGVSEGAIDLSHSFAHSEERYTVSGWSTTSPQGWQAQPGWFVFVESESRVWAYDGDRTLLLYTETSSGKSSTGTLRSDGFPGAVPVEVLARLSEPARQALGPPE